MSQTTLGILALYRNKRQLEELDYFKKLTLQGKTMEMEVVVFTPEDMHPSKKKVQALHYDIDKNRWYYKWIELPTLIYDRCRYQTTFRNHLLRKFRATYPELTYLNHPMALKWGVHQIFSQNKSIQPFLPLTIKYNQASDLIEFLQTHRLVFLKPINGTGGRGIIRIQRLPNGICLLQGRDRDREIIAPMQIKAEQIAENLSSWELKDNYLIQQGISLKLQDGRVHDYRLLIQKDDAGDWKVTGCAGRIGSPRSITSNLHGGGMAIPMVKLLQRRFHSVQKIAEIQRNMHQLSYDVVVQLEQSFGRLCELALDIAVDPDGQIWLLEVNPKPSREVFYRIKEKAIYETAIRRPLEFALWLNRNKA